MTKKDKAKKAVAQPVMMRIHSNAELLAALTKGVRFKYVYRPYKEDHKLKKQFEIVPVCTLVREATSGINGDEEMWAGFVYREESGQTVNVMLYETRPNGGSPNYPVALMILP